MSVMASQITSLTIVFSTVYSGADQRKHRSSVALAFVRGIRRWPGNSPHKWPVTRKLFPFDDVIMWNLKVCLIMRMGILEHSQSTWLSYGRNTPTNCFYNDRLMRVLRLHVMCHIVPVMARYQTHVVQNWCAVCTEFPGTHMPGLILGLRLANERRRYFVTTSLIGWGQA